LTKAPKPTTTSSRLLLLVYYDAIIDPQLSSYLPTETPKREEKVPPTSSFNSNLKHSLQPSRSRFSVLRKAAFAELQEAGTTTTPRFVARVTFEENRDRAPSRSLKSRSHGRGARRALAEKARGAPAAGRWPIELLPNRSSCAACGWRARAGGRQARMAGRGRSSCCAACGWRARPRVVRARTRENVAVRSARGGQRCWFGWRRSAVPSAAREASSFRCSAVLQGPRDQAGYARLHARCGAR
jgi:hypothetical protein